MVPFAGAVDFFLGLWSCLPRSITSFAEFCVLLVIVAAVIGLVIKR